MDADLLPPDPTGAWRTLADFALPSEPGAERRAIALVLQAVQPLEASQRWLDRLGTATGEAVLNAIEHGNQYRADLPVTVRVLASDGAVRIEVSDAGQGEITPRAAPDLAAKLAGEQSPRGWGLFLMQKLVDRLQVTSGAGRHTVEMTMNLERGTHATYTTDGPQA
jgi:anti-sigma regulatory factor (Ser/Thr protein kinase)